MPRRRKLQARQLCHHLVDRLATAAGAIALLASACTGQIARSGGDDERAAEDGDRDDGPIGVGDGVEPAAPPRGDAESGFICDSPDLAQTGVPRRLKRLTALEYVNSVRDLVGDSVIDWHQLPLDTVPVGIGFNTFSRTLGMSDNEVITYRQAAEAIAAHVGKTPTAIVCPGQRAGTAACGESFALSFTRRAWRRPLAPAEAENVKDIFALGMSSLGYEDAVSAAVTYALISPFFLFRSELGGEAAGAGMVKLDPYETATLVSYAALRSTPSDELMRLAELGKLSSRDDVRQVIEDLFASGQVKGAGVAEDFLKQWMELEEAERVDKDPTVYPKFSREVYGHMLTEFQSFASARVWSDGKSFANLFSDKATTLNSALASYYGLPAPRETGFKDVDLSSVAEPRRGILTMGAFTSSRARAADSFVQGRGKTIGTKVMCMTIPAPDPEVLAKAKLDSDEGMTHRQVLERVLKTPGCSACHQLMDPAGLALEVFDGAGVYRKTWSNGEAVDASGIYSITDADKPFKDIEELSLQFAQSDQASRCFAQQSFVYFLGESLSAGDECMLAKAYQRFDEDGRRIPGLWADLLSSDAMWLRRNVD